MSMPLAARSVTRSTVDFLAANLAALIFRAAESEICTAINFYNAHLIIIGSTWYVLYVYAISA